MIFEEPSPPLATRPKLELSRDINSLPDIDLAEIFKWLPPHELLSISAVCKRWRDISSMTWLRIVHLDLSQIPGPSIAAVIRQCPNLQTVYAKGKSFGLKELHILARVALTSISLHQCSGTILAPKKEKNAGLHVVLDPLAAIFSEGLQNASWCELILKDFVIIIENVANYRVNIGFSINLPASLKRLQLTDLTIDNRSASTWISYARDEEITGYTSLDEEKQFECLMLSGDAKNCHMTFFEDPLYRRIGAMNRLRELFLGSCEAMGLPKLLSVFKLTKLEVLFIENFDVYYLKREMASFKLLVTEHPTLRVLVLTGIDYDDNIATQIELPTRQRYPNGLGSDPLPFLHIIMDILVSRMIRFPSTFDAAKTYIFREPLAQFLEREDIKQLFDGVWMAAKIKEVAG